MSQIRIVTDSTAEIPPATVARLGIHVIPVELRLEDEAWRDGVDITTIEFLQRVASSSSLPVAVTPSVSEFQQAYQEVGKDGEQILSIHMSAKLGATVHNAKAAANSFLGRNRIVVLDSELTSAGLGMVVVAAAEAAAQSKSMEEIVRLLRGMIPHIYVVFFIESLEYLERNGLVDRSQAVLGNLLNIKPMLIIEDGEIMTLEKVMTREAAVERLREFISEFSRFERLVISHGLGDKESPKLLELVAESFTDNEITLSTYGPSLATHVGPSALGIVVYEGM